MDNLSLRQAHALIRERVRRRLQPHTGKNIWNTPFFIDRLDLAAEAYDCQTAKKPDGTLAEIDVLIGFVQDEFVDFVLMEDREGQLTLPDERQMLTCEECSEQYGLSGQTTCPECGYPNLYQITEMELKALVEQVNLGADDPIARRILAGIETWRVETAYVRIVTCFETFHKGLNDLAFVKTGSPVRKLGRPNLFQNIAATQGWFAKHHSLDLFEGWHSSEKRLLDVVFNKRHVITHNGGLKDVRYIQRTYGREDEIGQPVETSKEEILKAINLVRRIVQAARRDCPLKGM